MSGMFFEPMSQVPWAYMIVLLLVSCVAVFIHSRAKGFNVRREFGVLVKGIVNVIIFSLIVFSTTIFLKYSSYLKIDIMQLTGFGMFVVTGILMCYIIWKSFLSEVKLENYGAFKGIVSLIVSLSYPLKQIIVFVFFALVVSISNPAMSFVVMIFSILPINVIYHMYYIGLFDKLYNLFIRFIDMVDGYVTNFFGSVPSYGANSKIVAVRGHKFKKSKRVVKK